MLKIRIVFGYNLFTWAFFKSTFGVFYPYWYFFQEIKLFDRDSTFCKLWMQLLKSTVHLAKSKKLFCCQYLSFSVWFLLSLRPPYVRAQKCLRQVLESNLRNCAGVFSSSYNTKKHEDSQHYLWVNVNRHLGLVNTVQIYSQKNRCTQRIKDKTKYR